MKKILVVDDEQDICEILQYNLTKEGYEVTTANSAEEALGKLGIRNEELGIVNSQIVNGQIVNGQIVPDLILLDVMMGEMSGFEMAKVLKENPETAQIPIIFTTALDSEDDTVRGLNLGADDYIAKPLSMKEVKARVAAVLRRTAQASEKFKAQSEKLEAANGSESSDAANSIYTYEGICLNTEAKTVTLDGTQLSLTKLEFELLTLLLQNRNKVFSREELLQRCWPQDVFVLDRTVDVNITRLRKKLGRYGQQIKTRVGYGYCFES